MLKLVNKALEKKKPTFRKIKPETTKDSGQDNNVVDIEEDIPDQINREIDYGDSAKQATADTNTYRQVIEEDTGINQDNQDTQILKSDIPKKDWMREVERVSSKLKVDYSSTSSYTTAEWRSHLEQFKTNDSNLLKAIPASRQSLENLSEDVAKMLDKIAKKESMISKNFSQIISDYKGRQRAANNQIDEFNQLRANADKMQKQLEELEEKAAELTVIKPNIIYFRKSIIRPIEI